MKRLKELELPYMCPYFLYKLRSITLQILDMFGHINANFGRLSVSLFKDNSETLMARLMFRDLRLLYLLFFRETARIR
jgi:hypothetical protein